MACGFERELERTVGEWQKGGERAMHGGGWMRRGILASCEWAQDKISNLYGMIPVRGYVDSIQTIKR